MPKKALLALVVVAGVGFMAGKLWATGSQWMQPYRVSNLEWLALTLEVHDRTECLSRGIAGFEDSCTERHFIPRPPDTILVVGWTFGSVPNHSWDREVEGVKQLVAGYAKQFQLPTPRVEVSREEGGSMPAPEHPR
jgi:hypothetical protein